MTHSLAILALTTTGIDYITAGSSLYLYHFPLCWISSLWIQMLRLLLHWLHTNCDSSDSGPLRVKFCTRHCLINRWLCCRILKPQNIVKIGCPSIWYTAFGHSYLSTICNKHSLNPCNFNCCHSWWSQLYPLSKSCKILQHTDNSVPRCHHSYARTTGLMNYLWQCHMQGRSWSTHFTVSHVRSWEVVSDTTMLMSQVLQVHEVQFYICLLKPTSNSCINSVVGYKW